MSKLLNRKPQKSIRKRLRNNPPPAERILWQSLRSKSLEGHKFRRQQGIGKYIVDFYCANKKLVIEIDGDSHFQNKIVREHDKLRDEFLNKNGFKCIRFTNKDIYENLEGVLEEINIVLDEPPPTPPWKGGEK